MAGGCNLVFPLEAPPDAMPQLPAFSVAASEHVPNSSSLSYPLTIPDGTRRFLLVSVQLGTDCVVESPDIISVTYDGVALTPIISIVGTPCGTSTTRSDQWQLVEPDTGTHDVVVTLSADALTIHSGAMAFTGVDPRAPVRGSATAAGSGTSSSVSVASVVGDLVVNTVGQGNSVIARGEGQTELFIHNDDSSNTLNNSGACSSPGAESVTITWTFGAFDEWQTISSSLRP